VPSSAFLNLFRILDRQPIPPTIRGMTKDKPLPEFSDKGNREAELRRKREAEALRANLMRRKAKARERASDETSPPAQDEPAKG